MYEWMNMVGFIFISTGKLGQMSFNPSPIKIQWVSYFVLLFAGKEDRNFSVGIEDSESFPIHVTFKLSRALEELESGIKTDI